MDTIFMNVENSCQQLLNPLDKKNLKRGDKYAALSNISIHYTWKIIKLP